MLERHYLHVVFFARTKHTTTIIFNQYADLYFFKLTFNFT